MKADPSKQPSIVFVVDDDVSVREALVILFQSVGLQVETFASAQEFLQRERADVPSCLVLDVRLPGMSGLDFQAELAKANIQIPIIFMTGHGDIPMTVRAMKAGAVEFLTKPFRDQDMLDAVQLALERDRSGARATEAGPSSRRSYRNADPARAGGHGAGDGRSHEQADRRRNRDQRGHGEVPPRQRDAQDGREIAGRTGAHGGDLGIRHTKCTTYT